jgi:hypothetical protein
MSMERIQAQVLEARAQFPNIELHNGPTGYTVRAALMTSLGNAYVAEVELSDYPSRMPSVFILAPKLASSPHRYKSGNICYLHPSMWNPGRHNIMFVLARAAKWLNKYDIYRQTNQWVGAQLAH